jgi:adhesin/invasin
MTATSTGLAGSPVSFTATANPGVATQLAITTQPSSSAQAGIAFGQQPKIQLRDANSNAVSQAGVSIQATISTGAGGSLGGATTVLTNGAGLATFAGLVITGAAGDYTLQFASTGLASALSSVITVGAGPAASIAVNDGNGQSATVNTGVAIHPSVIVHDASNNPVSGVSVTFAVTAGGGTPTGTSQITGVDGIARVGGWTLGTTVGANTMTATSTGLSGSPVTFTATGTVGAATQIAVNDGNNQTATVGTQLPTSPSVRITDQFANPVSGVSVTFATAVGNGTVNGGSQSTDASGIARVGSWTLGGTAGSQTMTATSTGLTGSPVSFTATATPGSPTQLTITTQPSSSAQAGIVFGQQPRIQLRDASSNAVGQSGVSIQATISTGAGGLLSGTTTALTDGTGLATFSGLVITGAAGDYTLQFASSGLTSALSSTITVSAGPATSIAVNDGNNQSATVNSGVATHPSVIVHDASNNPVSGVSVTFAITAGGGTPTGASQTTGVDGIARVGGWTLGTLAGAANTMTATSIGLTGSPVTFSATAIAGAASQVAVNDGNNQTAQVGTQLPTSPSVKVTDQFTNPVSGVSVTFATAAGNGTVNGGSELTGVDGVARVGSWTLGVSAGTQTMTATSSGLTGSPVSFTATATAGAATKLAITTQPTTGQAGVILSPQPAIQLLDGNDNPVSQSGVSVQGAISSGPGGTLGGTVTAPTNGAGQATFSNLSIAGPVGNYQLTFSATSLTSVSSAFITISAGPAATIAVNDGNSQSATVNTGVATHPSVIVRDASSNVVQGVPVTFAVTGGGGSVTGGSQTTDINGIARVGGWTLGTAAGANSMTATATGLTGSPVPFTATGTPGAVSAGQSLVAATSPITASSGANLSTITITVRDQFNNNISGASVTFVVTGTGNTLHQPVSTTNASGVTTGTFSSTVAETKTVTATVNGSTAITQAPSVTVNAATATAAQSLVSASPTTITACNTSCSAGAGTASTITVTARDQFSNGVSGLSVTLSAVTGLNNNSFTQPVSLTNASGVTTGALTSTTAEGKTVRATLSGGIIVTQTAAITVNAAAAASIVVNAGNSQTATVGTAVATAPSVLVRDAFNNGKSGVTVTFVVASGGGSVSGGTPSTNGSGVATITSWTLGVNRGSNSLTATATGGGITGNPITFTATGAFSFATNVQHILTTNCSSCHPPTNPAMTFAALVNVASGVCAGKTFVVPSSPTTSYLQAKIDNSAGICGGFMPPGGIMVQALRDSVRNWITDGARP